MWQDGHVTAFIALLRGINVGGHKKIPMAELRTLCARLDLKDVKSYIQSGNLVFIEPGPAQAASVIEAKLEQAVAAHFGFAVDILVRSAKEWSALLSGNPFLEASAKEPHLVHMLLAKRSPQKDAVPALRAYATAGEKIEAAGEALFIHFQSGVARSKLSPAVIDRLVGSPVTARNVRTVQKLAEMAGAAT